MIKIAHVITELNVGGTEQLLYLLLAHSHRDKFEHIVISLEDKGVYGESIEALDIPVYTINLNPSRPNPLALLNVIRILRREQADIIQTWLYHADLVGTLASYFVPFRVLGWNIQNTTIVNFESGLRRLIIKALTRLSRKPDFIIANSQATQELHVANGYRGDRWTIIYNGVDTKQFKLNKDTRSRCRHEIGIPDDAVVIGQVGRLTAEKNYPGFIETAVKILEVYPDTHFVGVGKDVTFDSLGKLIPEHLHKQFHLLDLRRDVADLYTMFDIFTLTSDFEGLPNVVGEAMATSLPCAVTDAGDIPQLIGDTGIVVPAGDMNAMFDAWSRLLAMSDAERQAMGGVARQRIEDHFSIEQYIEQYETLYSEAVENK